MSPELLLAQRYRLIAPLGIGGMGSVWVAHDLTLNAEVAVKLINPEHVGSPEAMARFRREAQAAAAIRSTHVIQILDFGIDQETPYIAMERLIGESLSTRLNRVGSLSPPETARILNQVAHALALAHERGIVHRDVKPENIFLVKEGDEDICKILDFGVAHQPQARTDLECLRTQTGAIIGTPHYMSPEQANGEAVDHLSDIWAFGVIALECITGKRPFPAQSLRALFHAICTAPLPIPSQLAPVPAGFDEWFRRATSRERSRRFPSIRLAAEELYAICVPSNDVAVTHSTPTEGERKQGPRLCEAPGTMASEKQTFGGDTAGVTPGLVGSRSSWTKLALVVALPILTCIVAAAYWLGSRGITAHVATSPRAETAAPQAAIGDSKGLVLEGHSGDTSDTSTQPGVIVPKATVPAPSLNTRSSEKPPDVSRRKSTYPRRTLGENAAGI